MVTSIPLVSRTRATLRSAEFGFFGVWVNTRTQTPRFCGLSCSAGLLVFVTTFERPFLTSWLIVGMLTLVEAIHNPPRSSDLLVNLGFWLLVTVPHLLFARAVWLGSRDDKVFATAFFHAWVYVILAVVLTATMVLDGVNGPVTGSVAAVAGIIWLLGWPLSYITFRKARKRPHQPASPNE